MLVLHQHLLPHLLNLALHLNAHHRALLALLLVHRCLLRVEARVECVRDQHALARLLAEALVRLLALNLPLGLGRADRANQVLVLLPREVLVQLGARVGCENGIAVGLGLAEPLLLQFLPLAEALLPLNSALSCQSAVLVGDGKLGDAGEREGGLARRRVWPRRRGEHCLQLIHLRGRHAD